MVACCYANEALPFATRGGIETLYFDQQIKLFSKCFSPAKDVHLTCSKELTI